MEIKKETAQRIAKEIAEVNLDEKDGVYVHADGDWEISNHGCQPNNTIAFGLDDVLNFEVDDIADSIYQFFSHN